MGKNRLESGTFQMTMQERQENDGVGWTGYEGREG